VKAEWRLARSVRDNGLRARAETVTIAPMHDNGGIVEPACPSSERMVTLPARPEPLRLAADQTAVVVIDMQNAYASPGGYVDLAGFDIAGAAGTIDKIRTVLNTARAAGVQVIYLQNGWDPDYVEAGGPGSPNYHKSNALKTMRARPELKGRLLARGGWDYALVDGLAPQPGDITLHKTRYSAFFNSQLDQILRARGIRNIVFVGIATNVCVESTLRDGFHLEYFGVMLEDATHHLGPDFTRQATVYNVEKFFGWVSTVADFCGSFGQIET
jgi:ureidoacrylate peracid hydrolase